MAHARRHLNLTVLPNGEVLATSGVGGTTFNDVTQGVHPAEMWNPETGSGGRWPAAPSPAATTRARCSSPTAACSMPAAAKAPARPTEERRDLLAAVSAARGATGGDERAGGRRLRCPVRVVTPQAGTIAKVSLIRLGAVTHAFDENQRFQWLTFTADATGLIVTAPSSANRARRAITWCSSSTGRTCPRSGTSSGSTDARSRAEVRRAA